MNLVGLTVFFLAAILFVGSACQAYDIARSLVCGPSDRWRIFSLMLSLAACLVFAAAASVVVIVFVIHNMKGAV